jgi:uncharacterized protein (DUF433 family)
VIVSDPDVMVGEPIVAATRITVDLVLDTLGAGEGIEQLAEAHPRLTREAVTATLRFAAQKRRAEVVYPPRHEIGVTLLVGRPGSDSSSFSFTVR